MDVGTVTSVAQTLFAALQFSELRKFCSILGYKSELDDLQRTVSTIRAVLSDADSEAELSHEVQLWIEELKDAVFDVDDLLDEFVTLCEKHQLMEVRRISSKVRLLFSRFNPLVAYNMSRKIKKIRKNFDVIVGNHRQFGFTVDYQPTKRLREETSSYVYADSIIGREDDVENIVGLLLNSNVQRNVTFLSIVGIGGLGKTALAQLLYKDLRVRSAFPLRMWACVSDQDRQQLEVKQILGKILASATGQNHVDFTMDRLQSRLKEQLVERKFFIVLDDVWTENRASWLKLVEFFLGGHKGSWIVVTTRSRETTRIIGDDPPYELLGLSEENSLHLFTRMAFGLEQLDSHDELVKIGIEIVKGCAGVPLAIRVLGSLLYGQDKRRWLSVQKIGLSNITQSQDDIMPMLKLCYQHLEFPLKSCFRYCALFPKNFEIEKKMLISLWLVQGYVVALHGQKLENAAEEYFSILLQRCFIQDVKLDEYGEIISCKLHDLIHDLAQTVAGKEICITNSITVQLVEKVRHLTLMRSESAVFVHCSTTTKIRSCLYAGNWYQDVKMNSYSLKALLKTCLCLRALDLSHQNIKKLPSSIGELLHLRYLDLSWNSNLKLLPKSISKLQNLQTLGLRECHSLEKLPKDLSNKLVKLRALDIQGCSMLSYMPKDMTNLTCLHSLTYFVVGEAGSNSQKQWFAQLQDLKSLMNLKGHLEITIRYPPKGLKEKGDHIGDGGYIKSKEHLNYISLRFVHSEEDLYERVDFEEALMEKFMPHSNLKGLKLSGYSGMRLSSWATGYNLMTFLPNIIKLHITKCKKLEYLPCLENLVHLKILRLEGMPNL